MKHDPLNMKLNLLTFGEYLMIGLGYQLVTLYCIYFQNHTYEFQSDYCTKKKYFLYLHNDLTIFYKYINKLHLYECQLSLFSMQRKSDRFFERKIKFEYLLSLLFNCNSRVTAHITHSIS